MHAGNRTIQIRPRVLLLRDECLAPDGYPMRRTRCPIGLHEAPKGYSAPSACFTSKASAAVPDGFMQLISCGRHQPLREELSLQERLLLVMEFVLETIKSIKDCLRGGAITRETKVGAFVSIGH